MTSNQNTHTQRTLHDQFQRGVAAQNLPSVSLLVETTPFFGNSFSTFPMSLSFVSSAVQKKTEGGDYEETPINRDEVEAVNRRNANKPLYEQLRDNQEEEEAKIAEIQREMMRGTRALDEDDVAHLDALQKQQMERERAIRQQTQSELEQFRAARALRQQAALGEDDEGQDESDDESRHGRGDMAKKSKTSAVVQQQQTKAPPVVVVVVPKIKVKKRKRKGDENNANKKIESDQKDEPKTNKGVEQANDEPTRNPAPEVGGLSGLLSGYGSSSDED
jgi:hypothetical protein